MIKSREEEAKKYASMCDNESGSFLSNQLEKIRAKAHQSGQLVGEKRVLEFLRDPRNQVIVLHCDELAAIIEGHLK